MSHFSFEIVEPRPPLGKGVVVIGEFREEFEVDLSFWNVAEYRACWLAQLRRFLNGGSKAAMITSIPDPTTANFIFWWPMYWVDPDTVAVQHQVLMLEELAKAFDPMSLHDHVPDRETLSEDGDAISEWWVARTSVEAFVDRLASLRP